MDTSINLATILATDLTGAFLLLLLLLSRGWSLPARKKESRIILVMLLSSILYCVGDAYVSYCDGKAGFLMRMVCIGGNTYLFFYNLLAGVGIIHLVVNHIDRKVPKLQIIFFGLLFVVEGMLLIHNFFYPLVFYIDESNVYHRCDYYFIFLLGGALLIIYGYTYYFVAKIKNPSLRHFPVWQFLSPIVLAVLIQSQIYGISLQPVAYAIAFTALVVCLQNECIYIDKLTGVYNRYELEIFRKNFSRYSKERVAAIMLDLNGFKKINDSYSHAEGDNALVAFADILVNVVGGEGVVIRFAGDEFIVIIRKFKEDNIEAYKEKIRVAVQEYNESSDKPYLLSVSIGGAVFSHDTESSDFMATIDKLMYEDKKAYYKENPGA
ncbi:MAG: GGDEF domain-containing protein [Clostridiales bacterium]|nr:GGDEF domain-containing protein [Clostridiales bacterium]